jgi:hypothetical protein
MTRELTPEENAKTQESKTPDLVRKGERRAAGADTPSGPRTDRTTERAKEHMENLDDEDKYPKAPPVSAAHDKP